MSPKNRTNRNELSSGFNDEDRQQLTEINLTIKKLVEEVEYLKEEVEESKLKYEEIKTENEKLKQIVNTTFFKVDELNNTVDERILESLELLKEMMKGMMVKKLQQMWPKPEC